MMRNLIIFMSLFGPLNSSFFALLFVASQDSHTPSQHTRLTQKSNATGRRRHEGPSGPHSTTSRQFSSQSECRIKFSERNPYELKTSKAATSIESRVR